MASHVFNAYLMIYAIICINLTVRSWDEPSG